MQIKQLDQNCERRAIEFKMLDMLSTLAGLPVAKGNTMKATAKIIITSNNVTLHMHKSAIDLTAAVFNSLIN